MAPLYTREPPRARNIWWRNLLQASSIKILYKGTLPTLRLVGETLTVMPVMLAGGVDVAVDVGGTDELGAVGLLPLPPHATIDKTAVTTKVDREVISNWLWPLLYSAGRRKRYFFRNIGRLSRCFAAVWRATG